jgi:hypothetical protein
MSMWVLLLLMVMTCEQKFPWSLGSYNITLQY